MSLRIRDAGPSDAAAVAALHAASWRVAYRGLLPDAYLDGPMGAEKAAHWSAKLAALGPDEFVLLAEEPGEEEGGLRGFAAVWPDPALEKGAFIDNLHAHPDRKGRGVGKALFAALTARLIAQGRGQAWLTVYPDNARAVRFYERMGGRRGLLLADEVGGCSKPAVAYYWPDLTQVPDGGGP